MHPTAYKNCQEFHATYNTAISLINPDYNIVEIGSQNVNGSLRDIFSNTSYTGVDFVKGNGVDVILTDPYVLPFETGSVDMVLSSSVFEHSEMFWVLFLEIMRILKPHGLFYLNVPANGDIHRWPVDCWRFYPDSGRALVTWAKHNKINAELLESYTSLQNKGQWNDFVAVFVKDAEFVSNYGSKILDNKLDINNGLVYGKEEFIHPSSMTEDQKRVNVIMQVATGDIKVN